MSRSFWAKFYEFFSRIAVTSNFWKVLDKGKLKYKISGTNILLAAHSFLNQLKLPILKFVIL
jgi:hypothetical protein